MYEIIATIANLSALTVIGFIYLAYIKNLRSINSLKDTQLKVDEQNLKLWKDKVVELERKSPEFIEKQLNERIKIREDEISRLAKDTEEHTEEINNKNKEIESLKESVEKAYQYRKISTVWDSEAGDFVEVPESDLEQKCIGSICVDTASLMICDPWYVNINPELEKQNLQTQKFKYRVIETGEFFCAESESEIFPLEILGFDEDYSVKQMISMGLVEQVDYKGELPAIPTSYIKGDMVDSEYKKVRHLSFLNGRVGAGINLAIQGDGDYPVYIEYYKGVMQRVIIDL